MLADDTASRALWLGSDGALAGAAPGALLIECSTVTPGWIEELAAAANGFDLLDAPVTGSRPQAAAGQLSFLVGGSAAALERARPVLTVMSKEILHVGPLGSGAMIKLINNFVCGAQLVGLAEAIAMIERADLDREKAISVLTGGAPGSPLVKTMSGRMTTKDYTPNFMMELMAKDLTYAIAEAKKLSLDLTSAQCALDRLTKAIAAGHGKRDFSSVIETLR
jgi:3-hydroxyisobutyrate dehydrogenase